MYKLASAKKAARSHLVIILEDGLFAATAAYIIVAKKSRNTTQMEIFQREAENFAKAGAKLRKIIDGCLKKEWAERSEDCKKWLDKQAWGNP